MKKILIIANAFPPYKYVGRHRTVQYSKYLPEYGCEPIILTPTSSYLWVKDESSLREIPKYVRVYRAFMPSSLPVLIKNIKTLFSTNQKHTEQNTHPPENKISKVKQPLKQIIINWINSFQKFLDKYIFIPGQLILWLPFAISKALIIIKRENIEIVYTSAPAYSMHIIGYCLKFLTSLTWVADYRDLWTGDHSRIWLPEWRKNFGKIIESKVLKKADKIIVVSRQMIPIMKKNFSFLTKSRFSVISNGFDSQLLAKGTKYYRKGEYFNIVYIGQFKNSIQSKFFRAVDKLIEENNRISEKLKITFIGRIVESEKEKMLKNFDKDNLADTLKFTGWVQHSEAIQVQKNSDVLLLLISKNVPNSETILTGKIFEYISAQRPILALVPEGAAKEIIAQTRTGVTVHPENVEGIKDEILKLFKMWNSNTLYIQPDWSEINKYNRKNLTKKLAAIFTETLNKK